MAHRYAAQEPASLLWNPEHEVFIGLSYGEGTGAKCGARGASETFDKKLGITIKHDDVTLP